MSDIAVRVDHVSKRFRKGQLHDSLRDLIPAVTGRMLRRGSGRGRADREFWALHGVSFEVGRGEAFGIIGPNGAGKSTMLKLLSRLMKPTHGTIEVNGSFSALIELGAGFHGDLTGRENIYLYGTILGMTRREIAGKLDEIVEFAGLADFIDTPVKRYSSGMYARLGFSVAAHVNPDVLLVDEILSVGDDLFQQKCVERMRNIIGNGATVMFVSHNLKSVAEFCSRALLLDHGRAVVVGPTPDVIGGYMTMMRQHRAIGRDRAVFIADVRLRGASGPGNRFKSGQKAWVDVEVVANEPCLKCALELWMTDENRRDLFDTSTERLGHGNFTLHPKAKFYCTFELDLNLGSGIYHLCVGLIRYDSGEHYDMREAVETICVSSDEGTNGPVNCFPRVIRHEISSHPLPTAASKRPEPTIERSDLAPRLRSATAAAALRADSEG
jgi:ABC-type polysaccharide/polyol phosphate transport system ATPase subunit